MLKTILLHTTNNKKAIEEINSFGGHVTQKLSNNILIANFKEDFEEQDLKQSQTKIPDTLDESSRFMVNAWQNLQQKTLGKEGLDKEGLKWDAPGFESPRKFDHILDVGKNNLKSTDTQTSLYLKGTVAVGVVIVSSGEGDLAFSEDERAKVAGEVMQGCEFLAIAEPAANIRFEHQHEFITIPGDTKVPKAGMSASPSVVEFKNKLYNFHQGYGDSGKLLYNVFDGRKWAGDAVVPNIKMSESPSVVIFKDKLYCLHQGFRASGELFYSFFDGISWSKDKEVPNAKISASPSVVIFKDQLYCFHQGYGASGILWYNVFDGTNWSDDEKVKKTGITDSPSVVLHNNSIYCFHQGFGASGKLFYNVFDGKEWLGDIKIDGVGLSASPSVVIFNNNIYCFHQGGSINGELWFIELVNLSNSSLDIIRYESIWVNPALAKLGVAPDNKGCVNYVEQLSETKDTDWSYIAFFTKYKQGHFAYADGVRVCMQYQNGAWGPDKIHSVFAHETCHIFGADDEYGNCSCDKSGYYDVVNGNCVKCISEQVPCLMNAVTLKLCDFSQGQIGWLPQTGIFVFYQGSSKNGELWYSAFDGTKWWKAKLPATKCMTASPSVVEFLGELYSFHQGFAASGDLWYKVFDGANWSKDTCVSKAVMSESPSVVIFKQKLYCFYQDFGDSGKLFYNVFDGTSWSGNEDVKGEGITESPSVVIFKQKLYCFHQGFGASRRLFYNVFDGANWTKDNSVSETKIVASPSVAIFKKQLYCFYQSFEASGELRYKIFDGANWEPYAVVPDTEMTASPSVVIFKNKLYCFYQGGAGNGELHCNIFDGTKWLGDTKISDVRISDSPSAINISFE